MMRYNHIMDTSEKSYLWKPVEHTADLAIFVSSKTTDGLFRAALDGFLSVIEIDTRNIDPNELIAYSLEQNSGSLESNLVDFLNECIYLLQVEELVPHELKSVSYSDGNLIAEIDCRNLREDEAHNAEIIKATTYSNLEVKFADGIYSATIIFDT